MQNRTAPGRTNTSLPVNLGSKLWASRLNENVKLSKAREVKSLVSIAKFVPTRYFPFVLTQMAFIEKC